MADFDVRNVYLRSVTLELVVPGPQGDKYLRPESELEGEIEKYLVECGVMSPQEKENTGCVLSSVEPGEHGTSLIFRIESGCVEDDRDVVLRIGRELVQRCWSAYEHVDGKQKLVEYP